MTESSPDETTSKQPPIPGSEARKIVPFRIMRRGDDTVDEDNEVVFADFSPRVVPSDAPDEIVVPKDSAPAPVNSEESVSTPELTTSGTSALPNAASGTGQTLTVPSKPTSSSGQKNGQNEPPA